MNHIEELMDKVIIQMNDYTETDIYPILTKILGYEISYYHGNIDHNKLLTDFDELISETYNYASSTTQGYQFYKLTEKGKEAKKVGGHFSYLKKIEEKAISDKERQMLNDEKLKYDVKNAKRIFKTYWWTFGISILGFLLALGKIICDILKAK